jgi:hypothetical protein
LVAVVAGDVAGEETGGFGADELEDLAAVVAVEDVAGLTPPQPDTSAAIARVAT